MDDVVSERSTVSGPVQSRVLASHVCNVSDRPR